MARAFSSLTPSHVVAAPDAAAVAELQLGESARFYPTDAALAAWMAQAGSGSATVVYE